MLSYKEEQRREKISKKMKGKKPKNFGSLHSTINREKAKLTLKLFWSNPENHRKHSEIAKARGVGLWMTGKQHTAETKQKMSIFRKKNPSDTCFKEGFVPWNKGKVGVQTGVHTANWQGGKSFVKGYKTFQENKRRALKKNNGGVHTIEQWEELKKKWNYMCLCCKQSEPQITLTEDHIIPLSKGGRNDIENIQPLCMSCNRIKNARIINYIDLYAPSKIN